MTDDHIFFRQLVENRQIRTGARAIIINSSADRFLVEKNHGARDGYLNFIGGGLELGETLKTCLDRELQEETNARAVRMEYLFVVENFITFKGEVTHGLGHYFEVVLDREDVRPINEGIELLWLSLNEITDIDLRPHVVRDNIVKGTYKSIRKLISRNDVD